MNKQEFQQTIKNMKCKKDCVYMSSFSVYQKGFEKAKELALLHSNSLDEPEKPVVPQYVADFYESIKDDFENKVYELCLQYKHRGDELPQGVAWWFGDSRNKPIETLVMMHKFGYEVEHEQQYVVAIPDDEQNRFIQLWKNRKGKLLFIFEDKIRYGKVHLLTEKEIKQKDERLWQFAKEVEE